MLAPHLDKGFVGALHDALGADVDPRARGHLTIHGKTAPIRWMRPSRSCWRSEEHTSELQSLMRISYAVFCLKKKNKHTQHIATQYETYPHNKNIFPHLTT